MPPPRSDLTSLVSTFEGLGTGTAIVVFRGVREHRITYAQLARLSQRFAGELQRRNIGKEDRVLIWGENGPGWVAAFFGCVLNGSLAVPLDSASLPSFVDAIVADVTPRLIVAEPTRARQLAGSTPVVSLLDWPQTIPDSPRYEPVVITESDPMQIVFTSGTTGTPKGVVHTHGNVLASLRPIEVEMGKYLKYEKPFHPIRILHTLPLSHVFGQFMGLWIPALLGAEIHYQQRLVASEILDYISRRRISVLAAVPRILDLLQSHLLQRMPDLPDRLHRAGNMKVWNRWWEFRNVHNLFGWKFWAFVCGGASLSAASEQFWNALGFAVVQGYGMTETTALVSINHPFKLARGTVGQVLPGREVQLSEAGEVLVRGETISNLTWQHGQLHQASSDWLATGDLAAFDGAGNLQFRGRAKDVIVTASGLNIHPEDLEAALLRQPGVRTCAVVEADSNSGPEPVAVLVLSPGADPSQAIANANRELAEFQQIHRWRVWPEPDLPRTSTGKVLKREIVQRLETGELSSLPAADLNLDSLARVQLQAKLESQYGVSLSDTALQQVQTAQQLEVLMREPVSAPHTSHAPTRTIDHVYPRWPWAPIVQAVRATFLELIAMPLVRFFTRAKRTSRLASLPAEPVLIVANHVTSYDVPFILYGLPRRLRTRVAVAMSGEMILDWRLGRGQGHWFLNLLAPFEYWLVTALFNIFPLPQLTGFRRSFWHIGEAMDRGYSVLVFPEGRRSPDENPLPFKSGTGLLWQELGAPALPVRLRGLGSIKASRGRWFQTGTISISTGELIPFEGDRTPEQATELLRRALFKPEEIAGPEN